MTIRILMGLLLGIGCGVFFGELTAPLETVGQAFIGLLRMTVLPYIIVSLIANLGQLSLKQNCKLLAVGGSVLSGLWLVALVMVYLLASLFPSWKSGSFFSSSITEPPPQLELLPIFVPSNIFASLSENHVPAVVLLSVCIGIALSSSKKRDVLIAPLKLTSKLLIKISKQIAKLTPIGVFAMAASASGAISLEEIGRLKVYFAAYTFGFLYLAFIALPFLVVTLTTFRYKDVLTITKDAMLTAFATGKLIIVLPLIIEQTEKLFEEHPLNHNDDTVPTVDALYPIAYPFPQVGKLLSMLFVPFAAWFTGSPFSDFDYVQFLPAGLFSYFGGPLLAMPFLLDLMHLPHDMFQLFLISGVYTERLGDALGVMHLTTFTLLTTCLLTGRIQLRIIPLLKFAIGTCLAGTLMFVGLRSGLSSSLQYVNGKEEVIAKMQLLEEPVEHTVLTTPTPNPQPLRKNETLLERARRRGILRIGYNEDKLPFAYFNQQDRLVGFDINMAHALAKDLGVSIEFVRFDRTAIADQLNEDHFDIVMSGLVGTLERATTMPHTAPYLDVTLGLVVPDHQVHRFRSLELLQNQKDLKIVYLDIGRGFLDRLRQLLPNAELISIKSSQEYFESDWQQVDALLTSAESGSAFTLVYPNFEVAVPTGLRVSLPLFYVVGGNDLKMRDLLDHWIILRRKDGTIAEYYDHWVLGKTAEEKVPRWSIIRDVLHWVD